MDRFHGHLQVIFFTAFSMDTRALRLLNGVAAHLLAFGFFFFPSTTDNYRFMLEVFFVHTWGIFFAVYGVSSLYSTYWRIPYWFANFKSAVGLWLWAYILLSFVVFDPAPAGASELLLALPIISEWIVMIDRAIREQILGRTREMRCHQAQR